MGKSAGRRGRNGDPRIDGARQARREDILKVLSLRFVHEIEEDGPELEDMLKAIDDDDRLNFLLTYSLRCPDLFYFREALLPGSGSRAAKIDPQARREIIAEWVRRYFHMDLDILEARLDQAKQEAALRTRHESILQALQGRFGAKAQAVEADMMSLPLHEDWLDDLLKLAATCPNIATFHKAVFTYVWQDEQCSLARGPSARKKSRDASLKMLGIRFGSKAGQIEAELKSIEDDDRLHALFDAAAECPNLAAFRKQLSALPRRSEGPSRVGRAG
jgi:hypothetical protein